MSEKLPIPASKVPDYLPNPLIVRCLEDDYETVDSNWLLKTFCPLFNEAREALGINHRSTEFGSDQFARLFYGLAAVNPQAPWKKGSPGRAVGLFCYCPTGRGERLINVAITERGIIFVEPRLGIQTSLSKEEQMSSFFVLF